MSDDLITGRLDAIRERRANSMIGGLFRPTVAQLDLDVDDLPRLLAAVEAVLAMHRKGRVLVRGHLCDRHEAHAYFSIDSHEQADVLACPDCTATVSFSCTGCHASVSVNACPVRAAIERELTRGAPETGVPATTTTGD